jgi:oxaloacetate decarboxylase alpha subunit
MSNPLKITELVLRDAHQSLLATRMRLEDMLPIAAKLDDVGYWSVESWGGATFDSCIRYLGEDPWERIRAIKAAMPKTKQQMLLIYWVTVTTLTMLLKSSLNELMPMA